LRFPGLQFHWNFYQTPDGETVIDVKFENETVWLTQAQMIDLFGRNQSVISRHLKNIFNEKELDEKKQYAIFAYCFFQISR
jgi:hypothetical protein